MDSVNRLQSLRAALGRRGVTQLGVGPMSEACVDATIEIANERRIPMMLIASRRQIECAEQGGGYVNGWNTHTFADYVRRRDKGGYVLLCRDHGGPWQNYLEVSKKMGVADALKSSMASFQADLEAGFDILHLDPSMPPANDSEPQPRTVLEMLFELYDFAIGTSEKLKQPILIEVGTEEQNGGLNSPADLDAFLTQLESFTKRRKYMMPVFVVAQTGTLVRETRNVGQGAKLDDQGKREMTRRIGELVRVANSHGVFIKEHNGDYLSEELLGMRPQMGIGATNIAPEYGVAETRFLLERMTVLGLKQEREAFLRLAYETKKWQKWMVPNTTATDEDRAVIAGHYVFGMKEFAAVADRLRSAHERQGLDFDRALRDHVKAAVVRTMRPMGLLPN